MPKRVPPSSPAAFLRHLCLSIVWLLPSIPVLPCLHVVPSCTSYHHHHHQPTTGPSCTCPICYETFGTDDSGHPSFLPFLSFSFFLFLFLFLSCPPSFLPLFPPFLPFLHFPLPFPSRPFFPSSFFPLVLTSYRTSFLPSASFPLSASCLPPLALFPPSFLALLLLQATPPRNWWW